MDIFSSAALTRIEADEKRALADAGARPTVMIVDDREANLVVMAAILRPHYNVLEARDGQEALNIIGALDRGDSLACIVSDHRMPGLTGVQFLEQVKGILPWTRRVIVSGFIDLDAIIGAINQAGIDKFIAKPFDASEFLDTVAASVALFQQQLEQARQIAALEDQLQQLRRQGDE